MNRAKNAIAKINAGDKIVIHLLGNKVGRIGEVVRIETDQWKPLIPEGKQYPDGEMGRHILVRWDPLNAPQRSDSVIELPPKAQFTKGISRATICEIPDWKYRQIEKVVCNPKHWVPYASHVFAEEESISNYLGTHPENLEDGLQRNPDQQVREKIFRDKTRADVLLIDRNGKHVIIECKQGTPTPENVEQLRGYLKHGEKEFGYYPRGILLHGGTGTIPSDVKRQIRKKPRIEVVRYSFSVVFNQSE
jgi:hypothetical protein